ncbi:50S ribosomal protein L23 [Candidatus Uhrbacteria bacterium]|nr:50S ribosomal protein L23 [Candidatus Uhrbacteria bacterium]
MAFWDRFKRKPRSGAQEPAKPPRAASKTEEIARAEGGDTGPAYRVLIRPIQSEKAANASSLNQYVFEIASGANKLQVKEAVMKVYGIRPVSVNIVRLPGKSVHYGRTSGKEKMTKKAIVTLPPGKTISIYEGV